ncbi:MAG: hypothetical protein WC623_24260 [Pedobacter sp.]|uniref:hypothetical protein n=1 Tax=Pedobacter sp. TaxID=1411316 RepID=UPI003568355C
MTISEAVRSEEHYLRVSNNDRWLIGTGRDKGWIVYEHKPYQKDSIRLIETIDEEEAVAVLLGEEEK